MDLLAISARVASGPNTVKVWVDEDSGLFKVEYRGQTHSAIMPANPDEGDEPQDVQGDISILQAATVVWNGEPYFEMPDDQFSERSGGYWAPPRTASDTDTGVIKKTPGKGYCVKSEKNPDWNGGCFPSKGKAEKRLKQVEFFRHKASGAPVTVTKFEWDPGDKRSYGSFEIEADTPAGKLVGRGMINSGGEVDDPEWTLDGKPVPSDVEYPDLGIPHYYAGSRAMSRFEKAKDTELPEVLSEWVAGYMADMAGMAGDE
jgi:hypothetical protein